MTRLHKGFTLAELMVAVLILGQIATFTIPKVISAQQNGLNKTKTKELAAMVSEAYHLYKVQNTVSSSTGISQITQYLNFVAVDTSTVVDNIPGYTTINCANALYGCLRLHSGGTVWYFPTESFGGTSTTNAVRVAIDPDSSGSSKSQQFWLYHNGRIANWGSISAGTASSSEPNVNPTPSFDNSWFSWN